MSSTKPERRIVKGEWLWLILIWIGLTVLLSCALWLNWGTK